MKRLLILVGLLTVMGCSTAKYVPVETIERIEYRDSVVYVNDTITIEVPKEKVVYVGPADTLSQISTSLAFSEAKVEQGVLTHTLEQKGQIKTQIDTFYITQIKEVEKMVEVPIEVVKEVKHIPNWCWWSLIANVIVVCFIGFRIYLKLSA